jgi:glyoxylase-like metal-dependent hydrolase (beta-lactamase superfamily II)
VHPLEANGLSHPNGAANLVDAGFDARDISTSLFPAIDGYDISGPLVTALPSEDYDLKSFRLSPTQKFEIIVDGDIVDTGDRAFEVLHLPGHSPGAIGLWEVRTGILFSGDAIYNGPLIDNLHHSDIEQYIKTMYRLLHLPVDVVHAGHDPSFGKEKLREIALTYLRKWDN